MPSLLIDPVVRECLLKLRGDATRTPIDVRLVAAKLKQPGGHIEAQMRRLTVEVPVGYLVTFSIETGHPVGVCRHMSMSSPRANRGGIPSPEAVWMVAQELGFVGGLEQCRSWFEELEGGGRAVNVVQPVALTAAMWC